MLAKQRAVTLLIRMEATREAQVLAAGQIPKGDYDTSLVDYVLKTLERGVTVDADIVRSGDTMPLPDLRGLLVHDQAALSGIAR